MRSRPAKQEKSPTKTKRDTSREQHPDLRLVVKQEAVAVQPAAQAAEAAASPPLLVPTPVFMRCDITAPDGSVRSGWEMWIGDHCFGRADSKNLLLASFQRLQSPPESFHWREVRNRMQMRGRTRPAPPEQEREEPWSWEKKEAETAAPLLLGEEEAEGFQELTWETPA